MINPNFGNPLGFLEKAVYEQPPQTTTRTTTNLPIPLTPPVPAPVGQPPERAPEVQSPVQNILALDAVNRVTGSPLSGLGLGGGSAPAAPAPVLATQPGEAIATSAVTGQPASLGALQSLEGPVASEVAAEAGLGSLLSNFGALGTGPQAAIIAQGLGMLDTGIDSFRGLTDSSGSNDRRAGVNAALLTNPVTAPIGVLSNVLGIDYGGGKNPRQQQRDSIRENFRQGPLGNPNEPTQGLSFVGVGDQQVVVGAGHVYKPEEDELFHQALAMVDPIAEYLAGGDARIREDVGDMLATSIRSNSNNADEVVQNLLALIQTLGLNYDDVVNTLGELSKLPSEQGGIDQQRYRIYLNNLQALTRERAGQTN